MYGLYNGRAKLTPEGEIIELLWASRPIFNPEPREPSEPDGSWGKLQEWKEEFETEYASAASGDKWEAAQKENARRCAARARRRLFELARCNHFDLFITLTLDREKVDRYDIRAVTKKLNTWLDNRVRRHGLKYLLVPELHKDGAYHYHGLINSDAVRLFDSGRTYKDGRTIYNLPDWKFGFTTAVKLNGEYENVCKYIAKYVTKQISTGKIAGRYCYSGGDLEKPTVKYFTWDKEPEGNELLIEAAGLMLRYVTPP